MTNDQVLKDTRAQCVQRARAPEMSLTAKIGPPAPFLSIDCEHIDPSAGPEPVGCQFRFAVTITNTGVTAATDLVAAHLSGTGPCGLHWAPNGDVLDENLTSLGVKAIEPQEKVTLKLTVMASLASPVVVIRYNNRFATVSRLKTNLFWGMGFVPTDPVYIARSTCARRSFGKVSFIK